MMRAVVDWWGRNPVAGNLLMVICAIAGVLSFLRMDKEFWPSVQGDAVVIEAYWPGASPQDMETQVIQRIEEATADLEGVDWTRSRSQEGFGWVRLILDPGLDAETITQTARSRVDSISGLPSGMDPLRVTRDANRNWSIILGVHGDVDERTLRDTAENLRDRMALLPGGANTYVFGVRRPEVSIEVSEASLQAYGLTFDEVAQAVRGSSLNLSSGAVRTADGDFQLQTRNLADTELDFSSIIVRQTEEGGAVRLSDVAQVIDGFEDTNLYSLMNGVPSAIISLQTPDRFNIWETNEAVQKLLAEVRAESPQGVEITVIYNETEDYNTLMGQLLQNALSGFALIFVLLLLTLHPKVAFWSTMGVMTAFAGSFFILPYLDVSLNFMSVFGFLLVLGIMVDDAIIVGEAIYERAERGQTGIDASILATQIVLKPLMASVFVTMIAFSPLILIEGAVQQITRSISIVVMSTLVFSLIESLIILPAHLAHVTKPNPVGNSLGSRLMRLQQRSANSVLWVASHWHGPMVRLTTRFRYLTWSIFAVIMLLAIGLVATGRVKQTFMPEVEGDFMIASVTLPQTTPFSRMEQVAAQLDGARLALERETQDFAVTDPNTNQLSRGVIRSWSQSIEENSITAYVGLTPPETRDLRSSEITKRLEELLGEVPDAEQISFSLTGNAAPAVEIALMSENTEELEAAVEELKARLLRFSAVTSVRDSQEAAIEELRFTLLPGAEQLGIDLAEVSRQVRQAYFGEEVQRLPRNGDDVRVYVRYPRDDRRSLESLGAFRVRTNDGREVPLASVATWEFAPGVTGLDRRQRMSSILVIANLNSSEARAEIMRTLESDFFAAFDARYPAMTREAIGEAESQAEFMQQLGVLMLMAFAGIYFLLAVTFRSYAQPAMILCVIPFAIVGAVLGHLLAGIPIALFSWLGVIAAIGVVVNDNVVLVDRANQIRGLFALRRKGAGASPLPEDLVLETPNGAWAQDYDLVKIDPDWEIHEEFIQETLSGPFEAGPLELVDAATADEAYRERIAELQGLGFRVLRVKAERGIVEASISRFRQIFLTSVTEFVGTSPMILENAAIAQFLKPMVISLAFGVLLCMPATLLLTPAFYMIGVDIKRVLRGFFRGYGRWLGRGRQRLAPAE